MASPQRKEQSKNVDLDKEKNVTLEVLQYYHPRPADFVNVHDLSAEVKLGEWSSIQSTVRTVRRQGGVVFIELMGADPNSPLQVVLNVPKGEAKEKFQALELRRGSIIKVAGELVRRPESAVVDDPKVNRFAMLELIAEVENLEVVIQPEKKDSNLAWDGLVENGLLTTEHYGEILRMPEFMRARELREAVSIAFLDHFTKQRGFKEITVPALTQSISESGAEVFKVRGRAGELALNQSPQQIKQILAAVLGKVVIRGEFFRDDPSFTPHHLAEFTSLDAEMQIRYDDKWEAMGDVMHELEGAIRAMVGELANHPQALAENHAELPNIPKQGIPIISFEDAMEMVKNDPNNPGIITFNRIAEGIVAKFVKEKTDSDFYYIIGFPADEKPFYVDLADADTTYSFDLVYRGVEISSGGLRINDPALLRERLRVKGFTDLRQFKDYFDVFERGSIQTGGFGLGLERFVANSLGGLNVRLTTLFPKTAKTAIG